MKWPKRLTAFCRTAVLGVTSTVVPFASYAQSSPAASSANATASSSSAEAWYPSAFGANDTLGAANHLSADAVLAAARTIRTGRVYSLAVVVDTSAPSRSYRTARVVVVQPGGSGGNAVGPNQATFNDDAVFMWQGLGTQIDGLGHAGIDYRYYNGAKADEFVQPGGLRRFSIHEVPPLVTRGIVLDIAGYLGVASMNVGQAINVAEIEGAARRQQVTLRKGDVVLLHTGWMDGKATLVKPGGPPSIDEPGLGVEGARYLAKLGVVAVGADNDAVEVIPAEQPGHAMAVHQELLARSGVYLLENVVTRELVRDKAWDFLFVLAASRISGTVQANVHPVAIR